MHYASCIALVLNTHVNVESHKRLFGLGKCARVGKDPCGELAAVQIV